MKSDKSSDDLDLTQSLIAQIGRYSVKELIGSGGFGDVYLAYDAELERHVAIKVPNERWIKKRQATDEYLKEARMVATLDHANIVPVYDVGSSDEVGCYVVSKFIRGNDLRQLLKIRKLDFREATKLVALVASALHHAHKKGLVHRDIKPGNILIDAEGVPYVADFGLAMSEQNMGKDLRISGTPAYMSPEQARGEGHRVDGRSDIFSLGAVFYELLTGKKVFRGDTRSNQLDQVEHLDPKPLRQYDERLPKELDRICQKALAKRASERYWTAHDMAEDLRAFLEQHEQSNSKSRRDVSELSNSNSIFEPSKTEKQHSIVESKTLHDDSTGEPRASDQVTPDPISESHSPVVLPKGLRSFDSGDADFFLELLPGPRDRNGLPDSLRFWKRRIESKDPDETFSVGMIYGPSGCGKSSFVKAGLIPRLSNKIIPVFIESTAEYTEHRLLQVLRKNCPGIDPELNLRETVASIRRGNGVPAGCKIVMIFDQFERWLHARPVNSSLELVQALRQCDGITVSAILMVRSDFWMSVTRLLNDLEVDLVQGKNFAAVDLFPPRHARKVLTAFGRAFGALPADEKLSPQQLDFVTQTIDGLAQDGKLICVRLALYAEMMKNKPWTTTSLSSVGGTEGVGVSFLNDSFGPQANPKIRLHQVAARAVLKSLLPDSGTEINIQMKSYDELFRDSGYTDVREFDELIRVLDAEMRLISPTDPSGIDQESLADDNQKTPIDPDKKYFRLAHDYLVTALRKWLNRKQRETRRGRAELLLAERSSFWHAKHESRYLPSMLEHLQIRMLTSPNQWNDVEKNVMRSAAKTHGLWIGGAVLAVVLMTNLGWSVRKLNVQQRHEAEASRLVDAVLHADTSRVSDIVVDMKDYRDWTDSKLKTEFENNPEDSQEKLHAAMALVAQDPKCLDYLHTQLPLVSADRFQALCDSIKSSRTELPPKFIDMMTNSHLPTRQRLLAACAIAQFDSTHEVWQQPENCEFVAKQLISVYPSELAPIRNALKPISSSLVPPLQKIFLDHEQERQPRMFATESLVDYQADSPQSLFELLLDCDERQFPLIFGAIASDEELVTEKARIILSKSLPPLTPESEKDRLAMQQANAAVALYQLTEFDDVWPLLDANENGQRREDLRLSSFIIHWLANRGSDPAPLMEQALLEPVGSKLQAILLALGEFQWTTFDEDKRLELKTRITTLMRDSKTAGYKVVAEWLLRETGHQSLVDEIVTEQIENRKNEITTANAKLEQLEADLNKDKNSKSDFETKSNELERLRVGELRSGDQNWYYTGEGHLMIRLEVQSFLMGSLDQDLDGFNYENRHIRHINRVFALANKEVTFNQWDDFIDTAKDVDDVTRRKFANLGRSNLERPIGNVTWFEAVRYCNWLSEREGIPQSQWCYEPHPENGYAPGMTSKPEFWTLSGYRLPTQSEWEFACRAGGVTRRHYGSNDSLLGEYGWYQGNSSRKPQSVGTLKPNLWGFHDMHGNAMEWCVDLFGRLKRFESEAADIHETGVLTAADRDLRGGAYYDLPEYVRTSHRLSHPATSQLEPTGLRVARTLTVLAPNADSE